MRQRKFVIGAIVGACLNLCVLLYLSLYFGAAGAAWLTAGTHFPDYAKEAVLACRDKWGCAALALFFLENAPSALAKGAGLGICSVAILGAIKRWRTSTGNIRNQLVKHIDENESVG